MRFLPSRIVYRPICHVLPHTQHEQAETKEHEQRNKRKQNRLIFQKDIWIVEKDWRQLDFLSEAEKEQDHDDSQDDENDSDEYVPAIAMESQEFDGLDNE